MSFPSTYNTASTVNPLYRGKSIHKSLDLTTTFSPRWNRFWTRRYALNPNLVKTKTPTQIQLYSSLSSSLISAISFHPQQKNKTIIAVASGPRVGLYHPITRSSTETTLETTGTTTITKTKKSAQKYIPAPAPLTCVSYRHDGRLLAMGGERGVLKVVDVATRATLRTFRDSSSDGGGGDATTTIRSVNWLRDGMRVVAGGDDGLLRIWNVTTAGGGGGGDAPVIVRGHGDAIRDVVVLKDVLISGGYDHTVRVWDVSRERAGVECLVVMDHGGPVEAVAGWWKRKGNGGGGGKKRRRGDDGDKAETTTTTTTSDAGDDDDDELIVVSVGGNIIKLWNGRNGMLLRSDCSHARTISSLITVTPRQLDDCRPNDDNNDNEKKENNDDDDDNNTPCKLITAGIDGLLRIYDVSTLTCDYGITYPHPITTLSLSPNGRHLVIGTNEGTIDVRTRPLHPPPTPKKSPRAGTMAHFLRNRHDKTTTNDDAVVTPDDATFLAEKKRKLSKYDTALRQFRYSDALDEALSTKNAPTVVIVLEDLSKRKGLRLALSNRDEETLAPVLAFVVRYITYTRYAPLLVGVANVICDLYGGVVNVGQSEVVDELFRTLRRTVGVEVGEQRELGKMMGMIDMVLYGMER